MILCAAVRFVHDGNCIVLPCRRHGEGLTIIGQLMGKDFHKTHKIEQGFITTDGVFYHRKEALIEAKECGQLCAMVLHQKEDENDEELYSEDLY